MYLISLVLLLTETLTLLVRRMVDFFLQIIILAEALKYILVMDESSFCLFWWQVLTSDGMERAADL